MAFSLLACSLGGLGGASVKESRATEKKDEYLIQADSPAVYGQLRTEMEKKDSEVVKHTEEDEAYLAENKAMVVSLTKSEAVKLEKDATKFKPREDVQSIGFLGSYTKVSGTSLAAAHVTGVAAAVKSADTGRDDYGGIAPSTPTMYSPYHAKSQYSLDAVKQHLLFLYELARRRIMLNLSFETNVSEYGSNYAGIAISQRMQRRIVVDIKKMKTAKGENSPAKWDMPSKLNVASNSVLAEGYMIFGVFLHLVQDLQAHRAKIAIGMIKKADGTYYEEDFFGASASESHISKHNLKTGDKRQELITKVQSTNGLPMIRLKDYLYDGVVVENIKGIDYVCTLSQAYEDNPYFYSYRFSTAQSFSASYMANMLHDTADQTNRTTYLTNSSVPLA